MREGRLSEQTVEVNVARLWTARQGSGPPLVLLHGGPGLWDDFDALAVMLDDLVTVHRYDQRGSGRSDGPPPYDVATFVADLEALRVGWGHERWIVAGHSAGANLALAYTAAHPERVEAIIYLAGTGLVDDWRDEYHAAAEARRDGKQRRRLEELRALRDASPEEWTPALDQEWCVLTWMADIADPARRLELARRQLRPYPPSYDVNASMGADWRRILAEDELRRAVATLTMPTLVLHGLDDPRPSRLAERLAATLPDARLALIPACGHLPWLEQPATVRAILRAFIEDVSAHSAEDG